MRAAEPEKPKDSTSSTTSETAASAEPKTERAGGATETPVYMSADERILAVRKLMAQQGAAQTT